LDVFFALSYLDGRGAADQEAVSVAPGHTM
jgi:hypothetical protein